MPTQLRDMDASPRGVHRRYESEARLSCSATSASVYSSRRRSMAAKVSGAVKRYSSERGRGRERYGDGLCCSPLEANMGHKLVGFVDRHSCKQEAHRAF